MILHSKDELINDIGGQKNGADETKGANGFAQIRVQHANNEKCNKINYPLGHGSNMQINQAGTFQKMLRQRGIIDQPCLGNVVCS